MRYLTFTTGLNCNVISFLFDPYVVRYCTLFELSIIWKRKTIKVLHTQQTSTKSILIYSVACTMMFESFLHLIQTKGTVGIDLNIQIIVIVVWLPMRLLSNKAKIKWMWAKLSNRMTVNNEKHPNRSVGFEKLWHEY